MASTREQILDKLEESLLKLKKDYGYRTNLAGVKRGDWITKATNQFPYAFIQFSDGYKILEHYVGGSKKISQDVEMKFFVQEPITDNIEKLYSDLDKLFAKDSNILPEYWHTLSDIPEVVGSPEITQKSKYYDCQANIKVCGCMLNLEFIQYADCVDGSGYKPIPVPRLLDSYALTSTTDYLENQINSLTGQTVDLSGYSLTGHTHNNYATTSSLTGYVLNSTTGNYALSGHTSHATIETTGLITSGTHLKASSGYVYGTDATGGRWLMDVGGLHGYANYSLATFDINFSGANQKIILTSPTIQNVGNVSVSGNLTMSGNVTVPSGSAGSLPISFKRANGDVNYEGFYSIGSGIGVVTNAVYASAFMSTGFITKKIFLDTDMWQSDVNLYRKNNGLAFQTNTTDRMLITSAGNVNITNSLTANTITANNIYSSQDVIANGVSLTSHLHSFNSLTDISNVPKTFSVMDANGLPSDGHKEGDICIMYTNGGEDNVVYHSTYICINPSTGLTWQQIN